MYINLDPKEVNMSDHEILMKLEEVLKIDYCHCKVSNDKVVGEIYGYEYETDTDPEVFLAFCTIYNYVMKRGKYRKDNKDESVKVTEKGMNKLW